MTQPMDVCRQMALTFRTTPKGSPDLEPLSGSRQVFKIEAAGPVTGALAGEMVARVTEVHAVPPPAHQGIAITFTIGTEQGTIEGYYAGAIDLVEEGSKALIHGYGQVLSVTGTYADLFLAEVFVSSEVPRVEGRPTGENGQMTLSPRCTGGG